MADLPERPRSRRALWITLISVAVFLAIWWVSPWLYLTGMRVEAFSVEKASAAGLDRSGRGRSPVLLKVTFTTPQDIAAYRARWGLSFIQAGISACADGRAGSNDAVVSQGVGYFTDAGRVRALGVAPGGSGRHRYEAVFDDGLDSVDDDHELKRVRASTVIGGLCFRLHGATLASGSMRSARVRLVSPSR